MSDELTGWKAEAIGPCRLRRGERGRLGYIGRRFADRSMLSTRAPCMAGEACQKHADSMSKGSDRLSSRWLNARSSHEPGSGGIPAGGLLV